MKEKVNPLCFLRETDLTKPCKNIEKISVNARKSNKNQIEFAHKLNLIVSNSIKYESGSTTTSTSSKDALKQKKVSVKILRTFLLARQDLTNFQLDILMVFC